MTGETLPAERGKRQILPWVLAAAAIMLAAMVVELAMERTPISKSGRILLWVSDVNGPENSQQILDWYSFSHIIHGMLLYAGLWCIARKRAGIWPRFTFAILLEAGWEVLENSPIIIHRYRDATMAIGYVGDSVLNSMCDILCCALGFFLARKLPVWLSIGLILFMEIGVAACIRDNLTLNIIMLIHPFDAIKHWQAGAGGG